MILEHGFLSSSSPHFEAIFIGPSGDNMSMRSNRLMSQAVIKSFLVPIFLGHHSQTMVRWSEVTQTQKTGTIRDHCKGTAHVCKHTRVCKGNLPDKQRLTFECLGTRPQRDYWRSQFVPSFWLIRRASQVLLDPQRKFRPCRCFVPGRNTLERRRGASAGKQ